MSSKVSSKKEVLIERDESMTYIYNNVKKSNYRLNQLIFSFIIVSSSFEDVLSFILLKHPDPVNAFNELTDYINSLYPQTSEEENILINGLDDIKYYKNKYIETHSEEFDDDQFTRNVEDLDDDRFSLHAEYDNELDF